MALFYSEHREGGDKCIQDSRDFQNNYVNEYNTFNYFRTGGSDCKEKAEQVKDFSLENYTTIRDGYGFANQCTIDQDSEIRNGVKWSHGRNKQQLCKRVFTDIPNLANGGFIANIESRLTQGEDTGIKRSCNTLSEVSLYEHNVIPMIGCLKESIQNPDNIIPKFKWGGEDTRDNSKQEAFLNSQGYNFDGRIWRK